MTSKVQITSSLIYDVLPHGPYESCKWYLACARPYCLGVLWSKKTKSNFHLVLRKDYCAEIFSFLYSVFDVPVTALNGMGARDPCRKMKQLFKWRVVPRLLCCCSRTVCGWQGASWGG